MSANQKMNKIKFAFGKGAENHKIRIHELELNDLYERDIVKTPTKTIDIGATLEAIKKDKISSAYFCTTGDWRNINTTDLDEDGELRHISYCDGKHLLKDSRHSAIVIDGDSGIDDRDICSALEIHEWLKAKGLNHFVYSSYSNGYEGKTKWRAVIECDVHRDNIEATGRKIVSEAVADGLSIGYSRENCDPVRLWFFGKVYDPSSYDSFGYFEGSKYKEVVGGSTNENYSQSGSGYEKPSRDTVKGWIKILCTGGSPYHETQRDYSYAEVADLKDINEVGKIVEALRAFCEMWNDGSARWQDRYDDIPRIVSGAVNLVRKDRGESEAVQEDVETFDFGEEDEKKLGKIPWPPGMLGRLADNAYEIANYQYKEVALVSAVGLVAGIAGRRFNISRTGLNVYLTLIMRTGMGKDFIKEFVTNTLYSLNRASQSSSFLGASRFTGPKPLITALQNARSQVCVFTEAGILMKDGTGDQSGRVRKLLELYSCSGRNQYTGSEGYSDRANDIPSLRAAALTIISESTPETLLEAFSSGGCLENGHLPRQSIFRVIGDKPYMNPNPRTEIDSDVRDRLQILLNKCTELQATDDTSAVWDMEFTGALVKDAKQFSDMCVDIENEHSGDVKGIMASRMFVKAMKYAAIATVLNYDKQLSIGEAEWEWAKSLVLYEFDQVDNFFHGSDMSDKYADVIAQVIVPVIVKLLKDGYANKQLQLTALQKRNKSIPYGKFTQALRSCNKLMFDKTVKSKMDGLGMILRNMLQNGYVIFIPALESPRPHLRGQVIFNTKDEFQLTQEFFDTFATKKGEARKHYKH